jgi:hypothetical protein
VRYQTAFSITAVAICITACGDSAKQVNQPAPATSAPTFIKAVSDPPINPSSMQKDDGACAINLVNELEPKEVNPLLTKDKVKIVGWGAKVASGTSPKEVWLLLAGASTFYVKTRGVKRPDVATYFAKPGLVDAGWEAYADLTALAAGVYNLKVVLVDAQQGVICDTKKNIQLN